MSFLPAYAIEGAAIASRLAYYKDRIDTAQRYAKYAKGGLDFLTKNKTPKMQTPKRKRVRSASSSTIYGSAPSSSRKSSRKGVPRRLSVSAKKPIGRSVPLVTQNQTMVSVRHKRKAGKVKAKVKKRVKVPTRLKKQILQCFDSKMISGTARLNLYGGYDDLRTGLPYIQRVWGLPLPRPDGNALGCLFGWEQIMYIASRLWNGRPQPVTTRALSQLFVENTSAWSNFSKNIWTNPTPSAFSVDVVNLKAKLVFRSNSKQAHIVNMYVCKPKYQRRDTQQVHKPINDWNSLLSNDTSANITGGQTTLNSAAPINMGCLPNDIGSTPSMAKAWTKLWDHEVFQFILEPGQEHVHWIQGDEKKYDFSKMYKKVSGTNNTEFCNLQPTDRHVFFTSTPRMSTTIQGGTAHSGFMRDSNGFGLNISTEIFCTMKMPESAGTSITTTASATDLTYTQPLTNRKRAYFIDTFTTYDSLVDQNPDVNVDDNAAINVLT